MKTAASHRDPFQGVIVAALTPRRRNETSIDLGATLELIDFLGRSGASAIALLGSTGEFVHFALDDRRHMAAFAAKRSRVPLLVNVSHSTLDGAVELALEAADSGIGGVLLMPPYYFRYSQDAIRQFYLDFARVIRGALPIYLYNIPSFTNEIHMATALELLGSGLFAGIKDSSGSWDNFVQLREGAARAPFTILMGDDRLFGRARAAGAHGVVSGIASAVPELLLAIEEAVAANEQERVAALGARLNEFVGWILRFPAPIGIKEAARFRKLNVGVAAVELSDRQKGEMAEFANWFQPWLATVQEECAQRSRAAR